MEGERLNRREEEQGAFIDGRSKDEGLAGARVESGTFLVRFHQEE